MSSNLKVKDKNHKKVLFKRSKGTTNQIHESKKQQQQITTLARRKLRTTTIRNLSKSTSQILPISNCHSNAFTLSIAIGKPPQFFDVVIDTKTTDLWVPSSKCDATKVEYCQYVNTFDSSESKAKVVDKNFVAFAPTEDLSHSVKLEGVSIVDEVYLGPLVVEGQKFGAITSFPEEFFPMCGNVDGVIGMGKPKGNGDSLLEHLTKDLPVPVVSFYLNGDSDDYMIKGQNRRLTRNTNTRRVLIDEDITSSSVDEKKDDYFDDDDEDDDDNDDDEDDDDNDDDEDDDDNDDDEDDDDNDDDEDDDDNDDDEDDDDNDDDEDDDNDDDEDDDDNDDDEDDDNDEYDDDYDDDDYDDDYEYDDYDDDVFGDDYGDDFDDVEDIRGLAEDNDYPLEEDVGENFVDDEEQQRWDEEDVGQGEDDYMGEDFSDTKGEEYFDDVLAEEYGVLGDGEDDYEIENLDADSYVNYDDDYESLGDKVLSPDEDDIPLNNGEFYGDGEDDYEPLGDEVTYPDEDGMPLNNEEYGEDDDYVHDGYGDVYNTEEEVEYTPRPVFARSELILGGVNPEHYEGCLSWHPAVTTKNNAWSIELDSEDKKTKTTASIASATELIHGPAATVGSYLNANKAQCFQVDEHDELGPQLPSCDKEFDVAFYDCKDSSNIQSFIDLEFVAKGQLYTLGFKELIETYSNDIGENICEFRLVSGDDEDDHWVLGTPFFTKYYIALDLKQGYVGIAQGRTMGDDFCKEDEGLFVVSTGMDMDMTPAIQSSATTALVSSNTKNTKSAAGASPTNTETASASSSSSMPFLAPIAMLLLIVLGIFLKKRSSSSSTSSKNQPYATVDPSHTPIASAEDGYDSDNWDDYEEDIEFA